MRVALPPKHAPSAKDHQRADAWIACDRWVLHELFDEWNHCRDIRDIVDQAGENPELQRIKMDVVVILPAVRSSRL